MMRWHLATVLLLAFALVASACSSDTQPTSPEAVAGVFTGVDGVAVDVSDSSRIVSLTGDLTEIIFELGHGSRVVAVDITTTYPQAADQLKRDGGTVGFGQALSAEAVLSFEPTLVIGDETIEPSETIDQLRAAGVPVVILKYETTLDGVSAKVRAVAEILDDVPAGESLITRIEGELDTARTLAASLSGSPRIMYLYTRGPSLIFVFGADIPTNGMIEGAGAIDAGAEIGSGAIPLTPEALIAAAPDVIVVPQSGLDGLGGVEGLLEIPGVSQTPAGQNRAFLAYEEAYFFNLGPRTGLALHEFVSDLHALVDS